MQDWSLCQSREMQILLQVSRVSGIHSFFFWPYYVRWQSKDYSRLARTQESEGYSILLRFCKLLLLVHLQLLEHYHSIDMSHLEGYFLKIQLFLSYPPSFLLIGFLMLNSLWKLILETMLLLQSSPLLIKIMKFIQLLFTPTLLLQWSWIITHITRIAYYLWSFQNLVTLLGRSGLSYWYCYES